MPGNILRYQLVRIMKKFFYPKEKIDEFLTDKSTIQIQKSQITDFPSSLQPASHSHTFDSITGKPTAFPPASHNHSISEVTNLQSSLNAKSDTGHTHRKSDISDFSHTHQISEISDLGNASSNSNGLMSKEDKAKFDNLSYDSGWVNIPIASEFTNKQTLQARRIGRIVFIQGAVAPKSNGYVLTGYDNLWDIAYLPEQFRPKRTISSTQKSITKKFYTIYVKADGTMEIGRFSDQSGNDYEIGSSTQLHMTLTYFI